MRACRTRHLRSHNGSARRLELSMFSRKPRHWDTSEALVRHQVSPNTFLIFPIPSETHAGCSHAVGGRDRIQKTLARAIYPLSEIVLARGGFGPRSFNRVYRSHKPVKSAVDERRQIELQQFARRPGCSIRFVNCWKTPSTSGRCTEVEHGRKSKRGTSLTRVH